MWGALWKLIEEYFAQQEEVYTPMTKETPKIEASDAWVDRLIVGLVYAESRGDVNCIGDKAIPESKGGPAYGILQIRGGVRTEMNVLWGKQYTGKDLLGKKGAELSKKMCKEYFLRIAPLYKSYKASIASGISKEETCAKIWNGGPGAYLQSKKKGYEKYAKGIEMYWNTVRTHQG